MNFTVVLKQNSATVTSTTNIATWTLRDGWITAYLNLTATAAGTVGTRIDVTTTGLPAPGSGYNLGTGFFKYGDISSGINYFGRVDYDLSTTTMELYNNGAASRFGVSPSIAIASTDTIYATLIYRAA